MSDTKSYEVTQTCCLGHKVGDIIELTDKQAVNLINKVKAVKVVKPVKVKPKAAKKAKYNG